MGEHRIDYTSFYVARIGELENEVECLTVDLNSSRQREASLHDTIEGFKDLQSQASSKRELIELSKNEMSEEVRRLQRQVDALIDDNNSLRRRLKKFEDIATSKIFASQK